MTFACGITLRQLRSCALEPYLGSKPGILTYHLCAQGKSTRQNMLDCTAITNSSQIQSIETTNADSVFKQSWLRVQRLPKAVFPTWKLRSRLFRPWVTPVHHMLLQGLAEPLLSMLWPRNDTHHLHSSIIGQLSSHGPASSKGVGKDNQPDARRKQPSMREH